MDSFQKIIGFDHVVQEHGNTYISVRKCTWGDNGDPKVDIRKYVTRTDGTEQMMKGCSLSEDGTNELTNVLVEEGYGDTERMLSSMQEREGFLKDLGRAATGNNKDMLMKIFPGENFDDEELDDEEYIDIREEIGL